MLNCNFGMFFIHYWETKGFLLEFWRRASVGARFLGRGVDKQLPY